MLRKKLSVVGLIIFIITRIDGIQTLECFVTIIIKVDEFVQHESYETDYITIL